MSQRLRNLGRALALTAALSPFVRAQSPSVPVAQEFERLHFRSIGPAIMSGRISDFAVYESNPAIFYVATAHGGVWKTTSNGALMTPCPPTALLVPNVEPLLNPTMPPIAVAPPGQSHCGTATRVT